MVDCCYGGVPDVDGGVDGVLGFVGGVDCVGQFALASITDPSGHVLVVGVVIDGVNVCVHDGSFGFFAQSTGGGVPVVQLPAVHVDPVPFPPDADADDFVVLIYGMSYCLCMADGGGGVIHVHLHHVRRSP